MGAAERVALSRELVAQTALAITDDDGLEGLSMRKLGSALGVEAMSIYHYVKNKDDLLAALVDRLYGEIELPTEIPDNDWEQSFRSALQSFYDVLLRHPAALELFTTQPSSGANGMAVLGWAYGRCRLAGLGPAEAARTFHLCVAFVIGHAATELGMMAQLAGGRPSELDNGAVAADFAEFLEHNAANKGQEVFDDGLEMLFASLANTFGLSRQHAP